MEKTHVYSMLIRTGFHCPTILSEKFHQKTVKHENSLYFRSALYASHSDKSFL